MQRAGTGIARGPCLCPVVLDTLYTRSARVSGRRRSSRAKKSLYGGIVRLLIVYVVKLFQEVLELGMLLRGHLDTREHPADTYHIIGARPSMAKLITIDQLHRVLKMEFIHIQGAHVSEAHIRTGSTARLGSRTDLLLLMNCITCSHVKMQWMKLLLGRISS